MKYYCCTIIFLFCRFLVTGQDLSGYWSGSLPQADKRFAFKMETNIEQQGSNLSGTSRLEDPNKNWAIIRFTGKVVGTAITLNETEIFQCKSGWDWCIKNMTGKLVVDKQKKIYIIEGEWQSDKLYNGRRYYNGYCAPGRFTISKPYLPEPEIKKPTISYRVSGQIFDKSNLQPVTASLTFVGPNTLKKVVTADEKGIYSFAPVVAGTYLIYISKDGYDLYKDSIKINRPEILRNIFLTQKTKLQNSPKQNEGKNQKEKPNDLYFLNRKVNVTDTFYVSSDSLSLRFYDNGEIDNDTITVYFNKKPLLYKKRLTARAATIRVPVTNTNNELLMYADNLGSIPPNTALMVFSDDGVVKEVRINSDTKKSGTIIFKRKKL